MRVGMCRYKPRRLPVAPELHPGFSHTQFTPVQSNCVLLLDALSGKAAVLCTTVDVLEAALSPRAEVSALNDAALR